jgi:hypothetical protein
MPFRQEGIVQEDESQKNCGHEHIPVTAPGRHIRVPAFARFEDTLSVFEKTSGLTP